MITKKNHCLLYHELGNGTNSSVNIKKKCTHREGRGELRTIFILPASIIKSVTFLEARNVWSKKARLAKH